MRFTGENSVYKKSYHVKLYPIKPWGIFRTYIDFIWAHYGMSDPDITLRDIDQLKPRPMEFDPRVVNLVFALITGSSV